MEWERARRKKTSQEALAVTWERGDEDSSKAGTSRWEAEDELKRSGEVKF